MGSNASLSEFDDALNPAVVAYYFELARFRQRPDYSLQPAC